MITNQATDPPDTWQPPEEENQSKYVPTSLTKKQVEAVMLQQAARWTGRLKSADDDDFMESHVCYQLLADMATMAAKLVDRIQQ